MNTCRCRLKVKQNKQDLHICLFLICERERIEAVFFSTTMQDGHALDVVCNGDFQRVPVPNIYVTIGTLRNIVSNRFHINFPFILTYNGALLNEEDTLHDLALHPSRPIIVRRKSHDETTSASNSGTDLFLSYEQTNRSLVQNLRQELETRNYSCCMDAEKLFSSAIEHNIQQSTVFVCCMTNRYIQSNKCRQELSYAKQQNKRIIILLLEPMTWPPTQIAGLVSGITYIVFYDATPWPADKFNEFLNSLADFAPQL